MLKQQKDSAFRPAYKELFFSDISDLQQSSTQRLPHCLQKSEATLLCAAERGFSKLRAKLPRICWVSLAASFSFSFFLSLEHQGLMLVYLIRYHAIMTTPNRPTMPTVACTDEEVVESPPPEEPSPSKHLTSTLDSSGGLALSASQVACSVSSV